MAHKISMKEASEKYERELEIRELQKQGKHYKSKRAEKKRLARTKKEKSWLDYIKRRGGLAKPKEKKDGVDKIV